MYKYMKKVYVHAKKQLFFEIFQEAPGRQLKNLRINAYCNLIHSR